MVLRPGEALSLGGRVTLSALAVLWTHVSIGAEGVDLVAPFLPGSCLVTG